jgi:ribonucleoside-diphosphate reductase alpha chain
MQQAVCRRITCGELPAAAQIGMQAVLQKHVDNSISKTITVPETYKFEKFRDVFDQAYNMALKGCTAFRPNALRGQVPTPSGVVGAPTAPTPIANVTEET